MENQEVINLLHNTKNQLSKFRTKNLVEIKRWCMWIIKLNSQNEFKTIMLKTSLCDHSDAYILVKRP